jgi:DNA ligase 1
MTLFAEVVSASSRVTLTSSRTAKRDIISALLKSLEPGEIATTVAMLTGEVRQGRIGVGWATMYGATGDASSSGHSESPQLSISELDDAMEALAGTSGEGSVAARAAVITEILGRSTATEAEFIRALMTGGLRQGALDGVMADGVAAAAGVPAALVRRAAMLTGSLPETAHMAITAGAEALSTVGLAVMRGIQPMLASTSATVADAVTELGECSVEWKLDGARIQVHRHGSEVRIFTRNLNDVTHRLPLVASTTLALSCESAVFDGEALAVDHTGRPRPFQDTMSQFGQDTPGSQDTPGGQDTAQPQDTADSDEPALSQANSAQLAPFFFDILHLDGQDLLDVPLGERRTILEQLASAHMIPGIVTSDPEQAQAVLDDAIARGHEGVMVKAVGSTYDAGRRGKSWRKVKPVRTLDLVVLAAEWGHGRRTGTLSNLHLGAAANPGESGFVMVGKTFKGLTDATLAWQTEQLLAREVRRTGITVWVRPELVVEIAVDGVQRSTRYPGGVALRFARVKGYRHDRDASTADSIASVQAMLPGAEPD